MQPVFHRAESIGMDALFDAAIGGIVVYFVAKIVMGFLWPPKDEDAISRHKSF